ncbi:uncharacterized protein LOC131309775 [Rhododendron vialii]|uniref:uncharacterized protein LOC131309775 n=1 Tax=Rhododendron vialii TaxID=182163 RepID=UPI00265F98BB|nr:uncharacterized protein LOC131309775 [Rhododendron vialii]
MESQGRNISHTSGTEVAGQAQMRNDENMHQGSKNTGRDTNFLQQTGEGVNTMAQGAATMAQGAVHGAASIVQGAATGVANVAGGAASAVKNTLGAKNDDTTTTTTNYPGKPKY